MTAARLGLLLALLLDPLPRGARSVGAPPLVVGGYRAVGDSVRSDLRLVEVESARTIKAVLKTAPAINVPALLTATRAVAAELM